MSDEGNGGGGDCGTRSVGLVTVPALLGASRSGCAANPASNNVSTHLPVDVSKLPLPALPPPSPPAEAATPLELPSELFTLGGAPGMRFLPLTTIGLLARSEVGLGALGLDAVAGLLVLASRAAVAAAAAAMAGCSGSGCSPAAPVLLGAGGGGAGCRLLGALP